MRVVICGGGVIGACSTYFLSRREIFWLRTTSRGKLSTLVPGNSPLYRRHHGNRPDERT